MITKEQKKKITALEKQYHKLMNDPSISQELKIIANFFMMILWFTEDLHNLIDKEYK